MSIDLYSSDYQQVLLRLILIVDDVALFGGGVVTAVCFHSWLGALPCYLWCCGQQRTDGQALSCDFTILTAFHLYHHHHHPPLISFLCV